MRRLLTIGLVGQLATWTPATSASPLLDSAAGPSTLRYEITATLVTIDAGARHVSYVDAETGQSRSARLTATALAEGLKLTSGQQVTLQCNGASPQGEPIVESIRKRRSHKKLLILTLGLAVLVIGFAAIASSEPI